MRKRIFAEWGLGAIGYIEMPPTFHPPSLPPQPEQRTSRLLEKFLKREEPKRRKFWKDYLNKQTKVVMPHVTTVQIDPSPIFHFYASTENKSNNLFPIRYNLLKQQTPLKRKKR